MPVGVGLCGDGICYDDGGRLKEMLAGCKHVCLYCSLC